MPKYENKHGPIFEEGPELSHNELCHRLEKIIREMSSLLAELSDARQARVLLLGKPEVRGHYDRMLTVEEVAERLGLSRSYAYHRAKDWPFRVKLSPKKLRFSEVGLERWLAGRCGQTHSTKTNTA